MKRLSSSLRQKVKLWNLAVHLVFQKVMNNDFILNSENISIFEKNGVVLLKNMIDNKWQGRETNWAWRIGVILVWWPIPLAGAFGPGTDSHTVFIAFL